MDHAPTGRQPVLLQDKYICHGTLICLLTLGAEKKINTGAVVAMSAT